MSATLVDIWLDTGWGYGIGSLGVPVGQENLGVVGTSEQPGRSKLIFIHANFISQESQGVARDKTGGSGSLSARCKLL